jgi:hypothetical protein
LPELVAAIAVATDDQSREKLWRLVTDLMPAVSQHIKSSSSPAREYECMVNAVFDRVREMERPKGIGHLLWVNDYTNDRTGNVQTQRGLSAQASLAIDAAVVILDGHMGKKFMAVISPLPHNIPPDIREAVLASKSIPSMPSAELLPELQNVEAKGIKAKRKSLQLAGAEAVVPKAKRQRTPVHKEAAQAKSSVPRRKAQYTVRASGSRVATAAA